MNLTANIIIEIIIFVTIANKCHEEQDNRLSKNQLSFFKSKHIGPIWYPGLDWIHDKTIELFGVDGAFSNSEVSEVARGWDYQI